MNGLAVKPPLAQGLPAPPREHLLAALCYWGTFSLWCTIILWPLTPLIIAWRYGRQSPYLKKHAIQSLVLNLITLLTCGMIWLFFFGISHIGTSWLTYIVFIALVPLFGLVMAAILTVLGILVYRGGDPTLPGLPDFLTGGR